uniref:Uncharacterized protein n=1 Tax=Kalanchoe fedtschenkoi TaxID=63787 RepID=A0A7N0ZXP7_KALFE
MVFACTKWRLLLVFMAMCSAVAAAAGGFESEAKINLIQPDNISSLYRQSADDTIRADPLDNLRKYRGGYDVTNKHYWSSTVFTGIHGYAIGLLWLLCGVLFGGFLVASSCITGHKRMNKALKKQGHSFRHCDVLPLALAAGFTVLALIAGGLVLGENAQFYSRARKVVGIIIETADNASGTLYEATRALKSISKAMETSTVLIADPSALEFTSQELDTAAASILIQAKKNRRLINNALKILFITSTVTIALSLVAVIAISISGFVNFWKILRMLLAVCWILTFLCWLIFGVYFFIDNFASDTCTALDNFQQDPYNNTLSSLLPCKSMLPTKSALFNVSRQIYNLVEEVNLGLLLPSKSLPYGIQVCNPFTGQPDYFYQPDDCPTGTIRIGDIPKVLKQLTCSDTNTNNCTNGISEGNFDIIEHYATSIQTLLDAFPGMESLVECQTVKDAFTEITSKHCKPLKRCVRILWTATLILSVVMVTLVLTWTGKVYHNRSHHFSEGSKLSCCT